MTALPAAKIRMMRASIRCLIFGLLALLPVIGLPFGIAALLLSGSIRRQEKQLWNPGQPYRLIGAVSAALGMIGWFAVAVLIVCVAVTGK